MVVVVVPCSVDRTFLRSRLVLFFFFSLLVFVIGVFIAATSPSTLIRDGWNHSSNDARTSLQDYYACCGLDIKYQTNYHHSCTRPRPRLISHNLSSVCLCSTDRPGVPCPNIQVLNTTSGSFYPMPTTIPCMPLVRMLLCASASAPPHVRCAVCSL